MSAVMVETGWNEDPRLTDGPPADGRMADEPVTDEELTEEELTALALAADPDLAVGDDAISVWEVLGAVQETSPGAKLPQWYMPSPLAGARPRRRGWHRTVALFVIVSFLVIDALGLCITYGQLVAA